MSPHTTTLIDNPSIMISLIAVVVTVGVVSTAIIIYIAGNKVSGKLFAECSSAACRRAMRDMQMLMDYGADPCLDFHRHVCHHWQQKAATPEGAVSFLRYSTRQLLVLVNTSLSRVSSAKTVSTGFYNLAKFYRSCERFVSAPAVSMSDVLRPVQKYGENVLGLSTFPDVVRYIVELSLAHGIHTVLDIRLSKFPDGVFLHISRGQTLSQKMDAQPALALEDYLKELLGDVSSMRDREFNLTDIFDSERRLSAIMASESLEERLSATVLAYLTKSVHQAEWLDALNAHLPDQYKLSRWSIISTDNVDLIRQLLSFFRGLVDYGVVYLYIQVIIDAFRFDYLRRVSRSDSERVVSSCLQATRLVMRNAKNAIVSQLLPQQSADSAVLEVFAGVLKSITDGDTFAWLGELARKKALVRLRDISLHQFRVSYQDGTLDENDLEEASIASGFPGFFIRLKAQQQWSLLEDPPAVHEGEIDDGFLLSNEVLYDALSSSIVVPASLRREPILYTGLVPPEFVMGSLGVLLARSLLYAAFHANATGSWSPEESPALVQFEQCMDEKARAAFNVSLRERQGNEPPEIYIWAQSVRSAFDALRATYEQHLPAFDQGTLYWVAAQKTFFRRFCLLSCGMESSRQHLASEVSCFLPLLNMKEFSKAFNCEHPLWLHSGDYCAV
ncbi:hypothetical protein HPB49_003976 [Dermacentor silvarum]|uniref:Uncharacterized protein n=2 Tax=Dermacentor silvarum TaxID=543639 RepID=A0ACB8DAG5_DERSI|nr:hypothetical protein HPB49_003976 [Dermacentor silvarum]